MKKFGRLTALFCAGVTAACSLVGCGGDAGGITDAENGKKSENADGADAEKSMGRYLEEEITAPGISGEPNYRPTFSIERREDGKLVLTDRFMGTYLSEDGGASWERAEDFWSDLTVGNYLMNVACAPDGAVALACSPYEYEDESDAAGEETAEGQEGAGEESRGGEEKPGDADDAEDGENPFDILLNIKYYYIDPAGVRTDMIFPGSADDFITGFAFDRQNRLYGWATDGGMYRFDTGTGAGKELFEAEGDVEFVCFTEKYMVALTNEKGAVIYDLEQDMLAGEDKVLLDFVRENAGKPTDLLGEGYGIIAAGGEQDDVVYLAVGDGVYRHVLGGTVMERIIDGSMTMLGDPSAALMDMVMLPDNEFIVVYTGERLCKYTYDPNVPTVPERQLTVYSLVENYSLRQAVSLFQKEHQDVYVRYEIGMSEGNGVTREDAVRKLNTKIMAGEGPDILLLDGLPQSSYEGKGVLADVSGVVDSMEGEDALFPNVVDACRRDGKIFALPIRIQIPMIAGDKASVEKVKDLNSLADVVEELRAEHPEGGLLGLKSPEQLLNVLALTSSAAWTDGKGTIDERALEEFLTAAERIWRAELSGADEEWLESEINYSARFPGEGMEYAAVSNQAINVELKEQRLGIGKVYRIDFDYDVMTSIAGVDEAFACKEWNGQVEGGFIPDGMAGILAGAAENELAMEFYRFLFGRKLQDMDLSGGLPVNMASFDTFAVNPYEDPELWENFAGGLYVDSENGEWIGLDLVWPSAEEFGKIKEMVRGRSVVSRGDAAIEEAVSEAGKEVLNGNMSVETAVQEIVKKSAIYLAE